MAVNYIILAKGIIGGIERSVKYLMPLLFIFLIGMVIRNLTLPGAMEGVTFYLKPDFSKITPKLFIFVLGQVFFALSLGFGVFNHPLQLFKQGRKPYSHSRYYGFHQYHYRCVMWFYDLPIIIHIRH